MNIRSDFEVFMASNFEGYVIKLLHQKKNLKLIACRQVDIRRNTRSPPCGWGAAQPQHERLTSRFGGKVCTPRYPHS